MSFIAYQNKKDTFDWLNTLQVTFTIPRYRLGCRYRPVYISIISHYKLNTIQTFTFKLGINKVDNTRKTQDEIETTCTNRNFKNTFNDPD